MKTLYISGQMRSGTTLVATFLGHNRGIKILVDQARILAASDQAFKGKSIEFSDSMTVIEQLKLFEAFVNVTLWLARRGGKAGRAVAMKRLEPFLGYIRQIRSWDDNPYITVGDILHLPTFRTHIDFFNVILEHSVPITNRPTLSYAGNKETRGEKFAAAMASGGNKAIVVIRDPRAVVCSLMEKIQSDPNFGVKSDADDAINRWLTGYEICTQNPKIHMLRYEDFIQNHEEAVAGMSEYLGTDLKAGAGIAINNSSFSDVKMGTLSDAGISRWRGYRDQSLVSKITERCKDEILSLGYDL